MSTSPLLKRIARWCCGLTYEAIPDSVRDVARTALIDYVAVTVAGSRTPVAGNIQRFVASRAPEGACQLLGVSQSSSMAYAAYANGVASHALDFDDVSWATIGHPTVSIAPAVFAAGQQQRSSGKKILTAYIAALEAQHQIARWVMPTLSERGWHTTPVIGVFGAAVATACLLELDEETLTRSLAIAASMASGVRGNFGSQTKATHAGLSAFNGVTAVELALSGITGKADVIEARDGFIDCFSDPEKQQHDFTLGEEWDLLNNGLVFKQYPCCSGSHAAIDLMSELVSEYKLSHDMIRSVEVGVSLLGPRELVCHQPSDAIEAKFSMQYALASALVYQKVGLEQFTDKAVQNRDIQALMPKIVMAVDPELAKLGFIGTAPVKINIILNSGKSIRAENNLARGNPEKPLSKNEIENKYFQCTGDYIGFEKATQILNQLNNIDNIKYLGF